jgi:hypothetical protein
MRRGPVGPELIPVAAVALAETEHELTPSLERWRSGLDDASWAERMRTQPFSWALFIRWWVARRWVEPRDPTRTVRVPACYRS